MNDDFSKSLYFLDGKLASDIIDAYKKNGVIKSFLTDPSQPEIDIEVKNVALEGMQTSPYKARVDFDMVYYSAADHSELKRTLYTANFVFVFKTERPERTHSRSIRSVWQSRTSAKTKPSSEHDLCIKKSVFGVHSRRESLRCLVHSFGIRQSAPPLQWRPPLLLWANLPTNKSIKRLKTSWPLPHSLLR